MRISRYKLETYVGKDGDTRWRIKARNGKIIAEGGEGYKRETVARIRVSEMLGITIMQRANTDVGLAKTAIHQGDMEAALGFLDRATVAIDSLQDWVDRRKPDGTV